MALLHRAARNGCINVARHQHDEVVDCLPDRVDAGWTAAVSVSVSVEALSRVQPSSEASVAAGTSLQKWAPPRSVTREGVGRLPVNCVGVTTNPGTRNHRIRPRLVRSPTPLPLPSTPRCCCCRLPAQWRRDPGAERASRGSTSEPALPSCR
jgi:hypothetical protein